MFNWFTISKVQVSGECECFLCKGAYQHEEKPSNSFFGDGKSLIPLGWKAPTNFISKASLKAITRHRNKKGQFASKRDIPLHLRDKAVFERLVNEEHKMKFKTKEALDCAYEVKRNGI